MRRRATTWIVLATLSVIVAGPIADSAQILAQEQKPAELSEEQMEAQAKLGEAIGEALKNLFAPRPQPMDIQVMEVAEALPPLPDSVVKSRRTRLEVYSKVYIDWLDSIADLDPKQTDSIETIIRTEIDRSQDQYRNSQLQGMYGFADYDPVLFVADGGAIDKIFNGAAFTSKAIALLSEKQIRAVHADSHRRVDQLRNIICARLIDIVDQELFFTSSQREEVETLLRESINNDRLELYALHDQTYFMHYKSPTSLFRRADLKVFTEAQRKRWNSIQAASNQTGDQSERYLSFASDNSTDEWSETLRKSLIRQSERMQDAINVRIDYYRAEYQLSDKELRRLSLASKGTLLYCMQAWEDSTKMALEGWEETMANGNLGQGFLHFAVAVPQTAMIDNHQLWKQTLRTIGSNYVQDASNIEANRVQICREYLLAILDLELLLRPDQRQQLGDLLKESIQHDVGIEHMYEVALVGNAAKKINRKQLAVFLTDEQLHAWDEIKSRFRFADGAGWIVVGDQQEFAFPIQ